MTITALPLSIYNGNVKELKAQKEKRAKLEEKLGFSGSCRVSIDKEDKKNEKFYKTYRWLLKCYKKYNFKFIAEVDSVLITQYCDLVAEIEELRKRKREAKTLKEIETINKMLAKDREMLLKISRELYLTPATRVRTCAQIVYDSKKNKEEDIAKEVFE